MQGNCGVLSLLREYTPTDKLIESTSDETKEIHQLSTQWRLAAAQAIARTYPKVRKRRLILWVMRMGGHIIQILR